MIKAIAFDLSSGDKGSTEAIKAAVDFSHLNKDWKVIAYTYEEINVNNKPSNLEIVKCSEIINQDDGVMEVRRKKDATLVQALNATLEGKASATVSAAASGPLTAAGFLTFRTMEGAKPAFAPVVSSVNGNLKVVLDVGANIGADAEVLNQYATMGSIFAKALNISKNPVVKQLNIGEEDKKGTELQVEAFKLMKENKGINFKGNIEPNQILKDEEVDVIVTEAYSGNIALKSYEGALRIFKDMLKDSARVSFLDKIGFVLTKTFRGKMKQAANDDAGGACVLGLNHLLLKAHGSSTSNQLFNSLNDAKRLIEADLINKIKEKV